ncbi:MAG: putative manganese transporter [Lachnospiraceae bacterium]|nr:putative manganese transporter [Lachnospiraceae bacterium]
MIFDAVLDAVLDSLKTLPYLFVAFLMMEALEHHAADKMNSCLIRTRHLGPLVGALLGCIPQCGFSIMASNLYAGGVLSLGTLMAVYLATSDEALIILLSGRAPVKSILLILLAKVIIAVIAGYAVMLVMRLQRRGDIHHRQIGDLCRDDDCHCHDDNAGLLKPALHHTAKVFGFILIFTLALNLLMALAGFESLASLFLADSVLQPLLAGLIGLIPNCAASILLTQLYLEGILSFGAVTAGLGTAAGLGLVVLFRVNRDRRESVMITGLLYVIASAAGMVLHLIGI